MSRGVCNFIDKVIDNPCTCSAAIPQLTNVIFELTCRANMYLTSRTCRTRTTCCTYSHDKSQGQRPVEQPAAGGRTTRGIPWRIVRTSAITSDCQRLIVQLVVLPIATSCDNFHHNQVCVHAQKPCCGGFGSCECLRLSATV